MRNITLCFWCRDESSIFSRGAQFEQVFEILFLSNFLRHMQVFEKQAKKSVFRHLSENFDQKTAFFFGESPSRKYYVLAAKAPLRVFRVHHQIRMFQSSAERDPLGSTGGRIPEGEGVQPVAPKSDPGSLHNVWEEVSNYF